MEEEIKRMQQINIELQELIFLKEQKIKKLEDAIKMHKYEIQNHMSNLEIDPRQLPDWNTNQKLWDLLFD